MTTTAAFNTTIWNANKHTKGKQNHQKINKWKTDLHFLLLLITKSATCKTITYLVHVATKPVTKTWVQKAQSLRAYFGQFLNWKTDNYRLLWIWKPKTFTRKQQKNQIKTLSNLIWINKNKDKTYNVYKSQWEHKYEQKCVQK